MNKGGCRTGLIGGRFNMETEGFINRVGVERKSRMWGVGSPQETK